MIKRLLISIITFTFILSFITLINPELGFQLATHIGMALAMPIVIALKLAMFLRGGI